MKCPECEETFLIHAMIDKADALYKGFCTHCNHELYIHINLYLSLHSETFDHLLMTFITIKNEEQNNN